MSKEFMSKIGFKDNENSSPNSAWRLGLGRRYFENVKSLFRRVGEVVFFEQLLHVFNLFLARH